MRIQTLALLTAVVIGLPACATRGQVDRLSTQVSNLEARLAANEERVDNVQRLAEGAEARAQTSALRADDAARTAEAIFSKSVSK